MSESQSKNPLTLFFEWVGDQMYGVWLLFRPTSGDQAMEPEGTQPDDKASPPNNTSGTPPVSPEGKS